MLIQHVTDSGIKSFLNANLHPGGRKNVFGVKKRCLKPNDPQKISLILYDKFISDISSPYEHEYHFGKHESWL